MNESTTHPSDSELLNTVVQLLTEQGPQGFAAFDLPTAHQRKLRSSNALERVKQELKRRTRVAGLFPNEASVLRLITALLVEISEPWETGKRYLNMKPLTRPSP